MDNGYSIRLPATWCLLALLLFTTCKGLKDPKRVDFIVRLHPGEVLSDTAEYRITRIDNGALVVEGTTNQLGYFLFRPDKKLHLDNLQVEASFEQKKAAIQLNRYVCRYDIYLEKPVSNIPESQRVADFHYHVSMKPHNTFGQEFYKPGRKTSPPKGINWLQLNNKLQVYFNGVWRKPQLKENVEDEEDRMRMKTFLEGKWIRSKEGANNFRNFTEATQPHTLEGNVYLGFNAISPFEHSVSNDGVKRLVSSAVKSGANIKWLKIMGKKSGHISHWENFNYEYAMIKSQDTTFNSFEWSHLKLRDSVQLKLQKPLIVNVVEGGHIFQDAYFPHFVNYDLMDSTAEEKLDLFDDVKDKACACKDTVTANKFEQVTSYLNAYKDSLKRSGIASENIEPLYKAQEVSKKNKLVNATLQAELYRNVDSLKKMDIHMIAISHLTYNGLTGHAPALDVSQKPFSEWFFSKVAQRAYSIRVSNDKRYRKAYDGLFYRVPGVNALGDSVITRLLDASKGGRRIQIDLKHSDVITRRFILKKYEDEFQAGDTLLRPICSHCAVNGLSIDYTSPLLNEYRLLHSSLARKFYPFAINLYNEEVKAICEKNGIIGIPLEERVLGGYINNRLEQPVTIKSKGGKLHAIAVPDREKRYVYTKKAIAYLQQEKYPDYMRVWDFYTDLLLKDRILPVKDTANIDKWERDSLAISRLICQEYLSAESFLQNVFQIVDIAHTVKLERKKDLLVNTLKVMVQANQKNVPDSLLERNGYAQQIKGEFVSSMVKDSLRNTPAVDFILPKDSAWMNVCIGSDLDGLIDPINICPTASQYPQFREKLNVFIPLFLYVRKRFEVQDKLLGKYHDYDFYFDTTFTPREALQLVFYQNLKAFTLNHFAR